MSVKQISVFLENKPGALCELTSVLAEINLDMRAFSVAEASDFGIARIIVDDVYKTTTVLREKGFVHSVSPVLAVALSDTPGGLNEILKSLSAEKVNVEYMYAFLGNTPGKAYMVFKVHEPVAAAAALSKHGIMPLDELNVE